jgi:hypothetical protein
VCTQVIADAQFKQVSWINHSDIEARKPEGSRNTRFFCKKCGDYVGEDATSPLGIIALPTHVAQGEVSSLICCVIT